MVNSDPWKRLGSPYAGLLRMLLDPERETYLILVEEEIAGFVVLQMKGAFVGYIQSIGVFPQWQGQGKGSQLLQFAEERVFAETPNLFLCVSSFNEGAQRFYARLGYERVGELRDYVVAGYSEILLRKSIGPLYGTKSGQSPV